MEEEIALLRREALSSISSKGSKYAMDEFFERPVRNSAKSRRKLIPDITRDVVGAFGLQPKTGHHDIKNKLHRRSRSGTSSPSHSSPTHSYTSYTSSSHSRSRSSSSSSDHSSNSRSSSFSGSSRFTSPRKDSVTPSHKRKTLHRQVPSSSSDRVLEYDHRKQPRYAEDLYPPPSVHYRAIRQGTRSHRQVSKNTSPITDTLRSHAHVAHHSSPKICSNEQSHHRTRPSMDAPRSSSRHHPTRYREPRLTHDVPSYRYHSPPPARSRLKRDRPPKRAVHYDEERNFYNKHAPPMSPKYRSKWLSNEKDHKPSFRRSEVQSPRIFLNVISRSHSENAGGGADHRHQPKDRYIVVEDSTYSNEDKAEIGSSPTNKHRKRKEDTTVGICNKSSCASTTFEDSIPKYRQEGPKLLDKEIIGPTIELVSEAVKAVLVSGDDGFVEELDYNEEMDNLDIHPPEEAVDVGEESSPVIKNTKSHKCSEDVVQKEWGNESDVSRVSSADVDPLPISSPLRVSPERSSGSDKWAGRGKIPVKQRLYLSKQKIEEKRRSARYQDQKSSDLRPSLANRLGPPHRRDNSTLRRFNSPAKGSAMAIAEAYRKKKEGDKKSLHIHVHKEGKFLKSAKAEISRDKE